MDHNLDPLRTYATTYKMYDVR